MIIEHNFLSNPHIKEEPIGLAYIASSLEKENVDVKIDDYEVERFNIEKFKENIENNMPSVVCIGFHTAQAENAYIILDMLKKEFPNIIVICAGVHSTFMFEEALSKGADYVVIGEEEEVVSELVVSIRDGKDISEIKGIAYLKNGKLVFTGQRELVENINCLPLPAYHLLDMNKYGTNIHGKLHGERAVNIIASRGCIYNCKFCVSPSVYKGKLRIREVENVIGEIKWIKECFHINNIHFEDNDVLLKPDKWLFNLVDKLLEEGIKIKWLGQTRVNTVIEKKELIPQLKSSGFYGVELGIESGDQYVLDKMKKGIDIEVIKKANKILKQNGIEVFYLIISYNVGENLDSPYKSAKLLYELENCIDIPEDDVPKQKEFRSYHDINIMCDPLMPLYGSKFRKEMGKEGLSFVNHWSDIKRNDINFISKHFLEDEISKGDIDNIYDFLKKQEHNIKYYNTANFYSNFDQISKRFDKFQDYLSFLAEVYNIAIEGDKVEDVIKKVFVRNKFNAQFIISCICTLSIIRAIRSKNKR